MTIAPPIQSFEEFESSTLKFLEPPFRSKFGALRWEDQDAKAERPYEWQVYQMIPRRETVLWFGESQSGKSFSAFDASIHVAAGMPYQGRRTLKGGVVYCFVEKGRGAKFRMKAFRQHYDLPKTGFPFAALTKRFDIFSSEETIDALVVECQEIAKDWDVPLDVIVIDTHDKATPGASEIDKRDVSTILARYERLRDRTGAGVWVIGHSNSFGSARGSLVLYNAIETVIAISPMRDKVHGDFLDGNNRLIRKARIVKQSEGEAGAEWKFVLPAVEVGRNEFGEPITSCVVMPPAASPDEKPEAVKGFKPSAGDMLFLKAVLKACNEHGKAPPAELGLPLSVRTVVAYDKVKIAFRDMNPDDGSDLDRHRERLKKSLTRARERLTSWQVIAAKSDHVWFTGRPVRGMKVLNEQESSAPIQPQMPADVAEELARDGAALL